MHLPSHLINGAVCPVTAAVALGGVALAIYAASKSQTNGQTISTTKSQTNISALRLAAVVSFIFAAQMVNFPVLSGLSGHFVGITLAIALLGAPIGILAMTLILTIQCFVFGDGGVMALGANILNMALVGALPAILMGKMIEQKRARLLLSAWLSIVLSAAVCSLEIWLSTPTLSLVGLIGSMVSVHALIGVAEAGLTLLLVALFNNATIKDSSRLSYQLPFLVACVTVLALVPFASKLPDGLEWVVSRYQVLHASGTAYVSPFAQYQFSGIHNGYLNETIVAFAGVMLLYVLVYFSFRMMAGLVWWRDDLNA